MKVADLWIAFYKTLENTSPIQTDVEYPLPDIDKIDLAGYQQFSELSACEQEDFQERAAIMEFAGQLTRKEAEQQALRLILQRRLAN